MAKVLEMESCLEVQIFGMIYEDTGLGVEL